jgi:hypothetical protein
LPFHLFQSNSPLKRTQSDSLESSSFGSVGVPSLVQSICGSSSCSRGAFII